MKLFRFLKSRTFIANLLLIGLVCALVFWGIKAFLSSYTRHGENIEVPNLDRLAFQEAITELEANDLTYAILDTAEFNPDYPRGSVLNQYPEAGSEVKVGREIKLTINPMKPRKIEMPQLIEKTKRRAIYDLKSKGFEVGELTYVPYIGKDVVVDVKVDGRSIAQGEKFDKGTEVNLVLGEGLSGKRIPVPYLRYLSLQEARKRLFDFSLNVGSIRFDESVEDTSQAVVYRQYPNPTHEPAINLGSDVDIWLTTDYTKIPNDSLEFRQYPTADSLANDTTYDEAP